MAFSENADRPADRHVLLHGKHADLLCGNRRNVRVIRIMVNLTVLISDQKAAILILQNARSPFRWVSQAAKAAVQKLLHRAPAHHMAVQPTF